MQLGFVPIGVSSSLLGVSHVPASVLGCMDGTGLCGSGASPAGSAKDVREDSACPECELPPRGREHSPEQSRNFTDGFWFGRTEAKADYGRSVCPPSNGAPAYDRAKREHAEETDGVSDRVSHLPRPSPANLPGYNRWGCWYILPTAPCAVRPGMGNHTHKNPTRFPLPRIAMGTYTHIDMWVYMSNLHTEDKEHLTAGRKCLHCMYQARQGRREQ